MKKCAGQCQLYKTIDEFHVHKAAKDGRRSVCKICYKIIRHQYYIQNKEKVLLQTKKYSYNNPEIYKISNKKYNLKRYAANSAIIDEYKNLACTDCGLNYPPECMDFDHLDPRMKLYNVSKLRHSSKDMLLEEIKKCDVVCACCHRIRTYSNFNVLSVTSSTRDYYKDIVIQFKLTPCYDCNQYFPLYCMDLDHMPKFNKIANISYMISHYTKYSVDDLILEISKCQNVCVNCHRTRTKLRTTK